MARPGYPSDVGAPAILAGKYVWLVKVGDGHRSMHQKMGRAVTIAVVLMGPATVELNIIKVLRESKCHADAGQRLDANAAGVATVDAV